jgi:hypothetical protein
MAKSSRKSRPVSRGATKDLRSKQTRQSKEWLESRNDGERKRNFADSCKAGVVALQNLSKQSKSFKPANIQQGNEPAQGFEESLSAFGLELNQILVKRAQEKGYHSQGLNGRQLYDFVHDLAANGHALGEIVYKAIRYNRRKNPEDLVKIACWAFLVWDRERRIEVQS